MHELKELNLFDEINQLDGVINQFQVDPLRKDESFAAENKKSRNLLKESILFAEGLEEDEMKIEKPMDLSKSMTLSSKLKNEMYYYKR